MHFGLCDGAGGDADASLLRWVDGHEALPVVTGRPASASAPRVPDGGPRHATRRIAVEER